ncbi:MAG TPA: response regulator [Terriglobales bacterium]|nr:response regulator [Terriglobales bacterium]
MKATVLLVDEAQLERKINEWALAHAGYDVLSAPNGLQALRLIQNRTPDVIVLDSLLPDLDECDILMELKQNLRTARIPVIILARTVTDAERFKTAGIAEILEKEKVLTETRFLLDTVEGVLHPVL